jgi:SOS-response transcriptional repressor LexA
VLAVDAGLAPYIERGDILTVDPEVTIEPGTLGLAVLFADRGVRLASPAILIREFWYKTLDRSSRLQLVAKRAGYPNIEVDEKNDIVIIGAVVGIQKVAILAAENS